MTMWLFLILAPMQILAVYRIARLITVDDFPPIRVFRDNVVGGWREATEDEQERYADARPEDRVKNYIMRDGVLEYYALRASWSNAFLAKLFSCPFCISFWIACGVVLGSWFGPVDVVVPVLVGLSAWAVGGWLAGQDWS